MKYLLFLFTMTVGSLLISFAIHDRDRATFTNTESESIAEMTDDKRVSVIVELFTSEGCSSCPPADEALSLLQETQPVAGVEIIAISEHVDYWNRLGWTDPYSSALYSARQSEYARAFGIDSIYTPQMVVDGQAEFVGSRIDKARKAISEAARYPKATLKIARAVSHKRNQVRLEVRVENLPEIGSDDGAEVLLAVTENDLRSSVSRGENAGRRLSHSAVARKLISIGIIKGQNDFAAEPIIDIAGDWKRENLRAVIFVQERKSRRVLGAAALALVE